MGFLKGVEKIGGSSKIDGGGGGGGGEGGGWEGLETIHEGAWEELKMVFLKSR